MSNEDIKQLLHFTEHFLKLVYFSASGLCSQATHCYAESLGDASKLPLGREVAGRRGNGSCFSGYEFSLSALTFPFQLSAYATKTLAFKKAAHPAHVSIVWADRPSHPSSFRATAKKVVWRFCCFRFPAC